MRRGDGILDVMGIMCARLAQADRKQRAADIGAGPAEVQPPALPRQLVRQKVHRMRRTAVEERHLAEVKDEGARMVRDTVQNHAHGRGGAEEERPLDPVDHHIAAHRGGAEHEERCENPEAAGRAKAHAEDDAREEGQSVLRGFEWERSGNGRNLSCGGRGGLSSRPERSGAEGSL